MKTMTVKRLLELCQEEITKGNGDKEILLSNDDEGNGFHQCFYEFTEDVESNDVWGQFGEGANDTYIILG